MKRDVRLRGLSSEHHQALVLARSVEGLCEAWSPGARADLSSRFAGELEPHFQVEERLLLPALRDAGQAALAERTARDHEFLRAKASEAIAGDDKAARAFAERLRQHVRFEEQELFPACEALLPGSVLDEVARLASPPSG